MKIPRALMKKVEKTVNAYTKLIEEIDDTVETAVTKTFESIGKDVEYLCREAIDQFYNSYTPGTYSKSGRGYQRTGGLYEMVKIESNSNGVQILRGPEYSSQNYHQDAWFIYTAAFEKGYHGGVLPNDYGDKTTFYWRNGQDYYQSWGLPAAKAMPINFRITQKIEKYKKEKNPQWWLNYWWAFSLRDTMINCGFSKLS